MEKEIKINRFYFKKEDHQTLFSFKSLGRDENADVAVDSIIKEFPQAAGLRVDHLLNSICAISDTSGIYVTINIYDDEKATDLFSKLSTNPYFTELITHALICIRGIYDTPVFVTHIDSFASMCLGKASSLIASDVIASPFKSDASKEYAREMRKSVADILDHYIEVDPEHNKSNWYKVAPRNTIGIHRVDTLESIINKVSAVENSKKDKESNKDAILSKACDIIVSAVDLLSASGYTKMDIHKAIMGILQNRVNVTEDKPSYPFEVTFVEGDPDNFDFVRVRDKDGKEIRLSKVSKEMIVALSYNKRGVLTDSKCLCTKALKSYLLSCGAMSHDVDCLVKDILVEFTKGGK